MLRKVQRDEVRIGMFIHAIEAPWFDHPFWRKKFLLTEADDLSKLRRSAIKAVTIDESRGIALETPVLVPVEPPKPPAKKPAALDLLPASDRVEEVRQATKTIKRSKTAVMRMFTDARLGKAVRAKRLAPLVEEISLLVEKNSSMLLDIVRLKTKDEYTYMHSVAVCALMINLARKLKLDESMIHEVGMAGLLHDVGKMAVPDDLLLKPGRLTDDEFATIRTHPERGAEILRRGENVPEMAIDVCLHHHEKVDGKGYPQRLGAEQLSVVARMSAICDVYDAVTSERPYKKAWSPSVALSRMMSWEGHFDQLILRAFVESLGIIPVGALVRLRSDRLAIVIGSCEQEPSQPRVRVFHSIAHNRAIPHQDLDLPRSYRDDRIDGIEDPRIWGFDDWEAKRQTLLGSGEGESGQ